PGPIIGLLLLFVALLLRGRASESRQLAASSLLRYLPLLLVPPAVGVMVYTEAILQDFWAIVGVLVISLLIALVVPGWLMPALIHHPLFGVGITLTAFQLAFAAYEKTRWVFLQPVLLSALLVIGVLLLCGLSYADYADSARLLTVMLGPATVALAVPLYLNLR